jgi:hypothetical protein
VLPAVGESGVPDYGEETRLQLYEDCNVDLWYVFWLLDFVVASLAFVLIWLVVTVGGVRNLRELFRALERERRPD